MTSNKQNKTEGTSCGAQGAFRGHKGTSKNSNLCPHKLLFSLSFLLKGHKGTNKEGGIRDMNNTYKIRAFSMVMTFSYALALTLNNLCPSTLGHLEVAS